MVEKYCDIKYRDCVLEIDEYNDTEPVENHYFKGKSPNMGIYEGRSLVGRYTKVMQLINEFVLLIDRLLGEEEKDVDEEGHYLFCSIICQGYELEIYLSVEDSSYMAWIDGFDFASWGTWSKEVFLSVIESFKKKVDSGTGEDLIHTFCHHEGRTLIVKKKGELYTGTSYVHGEDWQPCDIQQHNIGNKVYTLTIQVDPINGDFFGSCEIHKHSVFKCFSRSFREIEDKFKARLDQIVRHKELAQGVTFEVEGIAGRKPLYHKGYTLWVHKCRNLYYGSCTHPEILYGGSNSVYTSLVSDFKKYVDDKVSSSWSNDSKQERIKELEKQIANLSAELEKVKNEKMS